MDQLFANSTAANAVKNRRNILCEEILSLVKSKDRPITIASLACGPAREIFDVYEALPDKTKLKATLLDLDLQALAFVDEKRSQLGLRKQIELINDNLIYLAIGKKQLNLPPFDLIYSIGLIDYFDDNLVIGLINFIYDNLIAGEKLF